MWSLCSVEIPVFFRQLTRNNMFTSTSNIKPDAEIAVLVDIITFKKIFASLTVVYIVVDEAFCPCR